MGIEDDGFCNLVDDEGETKDDLPLPTEPEFAEVSKLYKVLMFKMVKKLKADFEADKDLIVQVISAMGVEKIVDFKLDTTS